MNIHNKSSVTISHSLSIKVFLLVSLSYTYMSSEWFWADIYSSKWLISKQSLEYQFYSQRSSWNRISFSRWLFKYIKHAIRNFNHLFKCQLHCKYWIILIKVVFHYDNHIKKETETVSYYYTSSWKWPMLTKMVFE
jgi:hypothetical protein